MAIVYSTAIQNTIKISIYIENTKWLTFVSCRLPSSLLSVNFEFLSIYGEPFLAYLQAYINKPGKMQSMK